MSFHLVRACVRAWQGRVGCSGIVCFMGVDQTASSSTTASASFSFSASWFLLEDGWRSSLLDSIGCCWSEERDEDAEVDDDDDSEVVAAAEGSGAAEVRTSAGSPMATSSAELESPESQGPVLKRALSCMQKQKRICSPYPLPLALLPHHFLQVLLSSTKRTSWSS
jgi:hypothetical protein